MRSRTVPLSAWALMAIALYARGGRECCQSEEKEAESSRLSVGGCNRKRRLLDWAGEIREMEWDTEKSMGCCSKNWRERQMRSRSDISGQTKFASTERTTARP